MISASYGPLRQLSLDGESETPEESQVHGHGTVQRRGLLAALLCSLSLTALAVASVAMAPVSLLRGRTGSSHELDGSSPAIASIITARDLHGNMTSSGNTTLSTTFSKTITRTGTTATTTTGTRTTRTTVSSTSITTTTILHCRTPAEDDACWNSMLWVQAQMNSQGVHVSESESQSFLEDIQQRLFDKDLGGCHHRPCPVSKHVPFIEVNRDCLTAAWPSPCYWEVHRTYNDIVHHPDWYQGLDSTSAPLEVQQHLYTRGHTSCQMPCPELLDPSIILFRPPRSSSQEVQLCAKDAAIPQHIETATFESTSQEEDVCYNFLAARGAAHGSRYSGRKWCWVALKYNGCIAHWSIQLSWKTMLSSGEKFGLHRPASFHPLAHSEMCDSASLGGSVEWTTQEWEEALDWFEQFASVYVLSLPSDKLRRTKSSECMGKANIKEFEFVDGFDMRQPAALGVAEMEGLVPKSYDKQKAQGEAYRQGMGAIMGTLGCLVGHLRAQRRGVIHNRRKATLVFEDDICPNEDFIPRLWRLVTGELPCDWQAVSLQSKCPVGSCISPHLTRVQPDHNEVASTCRHGVNFAMYGVLYRTDAVESLQNELKQIVFDETLPHCLDVDVAMAAISDKINYYAVPASQQPGFLREIPEGSARVAVNSGSHQ